MEKHTNIKLLGVLIGVIAFVLGGTPAYAGEKAIVFSFSSIGIDAQERLASQQLFAQEIEKAGFTIVLHNVFPGESAEDVATRVGCSVYFTGSVNVEGTDTIVEIQKTTLGQKEKIKAHLIAKIRNNLPDAIIIAAQTLAQNKNLFAEIVPPPVVASQMVLSTPQVARHTLNGPALSLGKPMDLVVVEDAFGGKNLSKLYKRFELSSDFGQMSFAQHFYKIEKKRKKTGAIFAAVLAPLTLVGGMSLGGAMIAAGFNGDGGEGAVILGSMLMVSAIPGSIAFLVSGIVKIVKGRKRMRRLEPLVSSGAIAKKSYPKPQMDLSVITSSTGVPAGPALTLSF